MFVFNWNRRLRIGDSQLLDVMQDQLRNITPRPELLDSFSWNKKDNYSAAGFRRKLLCSPHHILPATGFFPAGVSTVHNGTLVSRDLNYSFCWKFKLPPKISFFLWLLLRNRVSSNVSLANRGIISVDHIPCSFCFHDEDSLHIFMYCRYSWLFWSKLLNMCNVITVPPNTLIAFFLFWEDIALRKFKGFWQTLWFFGVWELWKVRNKRVFRHEHTEVDTTIFMTICKAVEFYKDNHHGFTYSGNDVFRNLTFFCKFA
ncbi:uncharacterized protein LOC126681343 [Mercurialis annua]|uniref:uncharacterized protein LOC126681343 n=1 Tax=Mercurialis annua TaxID=3986 RepID=UPI00215EE5C9|nr:uncharacterized protein LOC126681343 [Mercurialis annua]